MPRDGGLADPELANDLLRVPLASAEQLDDPQPGAIGQGTQPRQQVRRDDGARFRLRHRARPLAVEVEDQLWRVEDELDEVAQMIRRAKRDPLDAGQRELHLLRQPVAAQLLEGDSHPRVGRGSRLPDRPAHLREHPPVLLLVALVPEALQQRDGPRFQLFRCQHQAHDLVEIGSRDAWLEERPPCRRIVCLGRRLADAAVCIDPEHRLDSHAPICPCWQPAQMGDVGLEVGVEALRPQGVERHQDFFDVIQQPPREPQQGIELVLPVFPECLSRLDQPAIKPARVGRSIDERDYRGQIERNRDGKFQLERRPAYQ
ncbi:hypothetical protein HRbin26_02361 [bacterium HR26]|nr:hypothetical protein HRbin26_02361 [bacterium HR26]